MASPINLRETVSWFQWSSSWLFVAGLVVILLGPSWWSIAIGGWFGLWLVLGMGLAVKRGGWGFWAALVLEAFIIFAGVGVVHWLIESSKAAGLDAVLNRIHDSADWTATKTALETAQGLVTSLTARLNALPADWVTKASEVAAQIQAQQTTAQNLVAHLADLEAGAKTSSVVTSATAFEVFGPNTVTIVLMILGIGNELVALANMVGRKNETAERSPGVLERLKIVTIAWWNRLRGHVVAPVAPRADHGRTELVAADRTPVIAPEAEVDDAPTITVQEFVEMRLTLLRQGLPNGYRPIIEAFAEQGRKLSDRKARELNAESIKLGLVRGHTGPAINQVINHNSVASS